MACGGLAAPAAKRAALAVADAVERHGRGFAPGAEPAYHDRHHQAEAVLAMAALVRAARGASLLDPREAPLLLLAIAGHDLFHDGSVAGPAGRLEAASAAATAGLAASAGVDPAGIDEVRRLIAATEPSFRPAADDLPARLVREADVMGSLMPQLGWQLSRALAAERAAAGADDRPTVDSFEGRLRWLRGVAAESLPAVSLGAARNRRDQIAAFALAAAAPTADEGARLLDRRTPDAAHADYRAALAALAGKPA
jgi:hypothetical protein